ncbi:restriction endonuclease [Arthrobacter sp. RHLT1-20]
MAGQSCGRCSALVQPLRQLVNGAWQPQGPPPPRMASCTPREAEYVAAQWMRYLGATSCRVTQASRDGGMDIVSDTHVAEVKHHQSPVGVSFVRQIYGTATGASKRAMFFSLSE